MGRLPRLTGTLALATCGVLAFTACSSGGQQSGSGNSGGKQYVIGWADPQAKQPIFDAFTRALEAAAARENIKIITLDAGANPSTQVSNIQTFITKKVNAIIVFPDDANALVPALTRARQAGIKIVGFNAVTPTNGQVPKVSAPYDTDLDQGFNLTGAREAGQFVAQQLNGTGNVIGIKIPVPVPSLIALLDNYQKWVTDGHPGIKWLGTVPDATDDLAGAQKSMADAITRYQGQINAVMSYTDIGAIGAYQALQSAGIKGAVIVGQQGSQTGIDAVRSGQIQGDIDDQPWMEAVYALALARDLMTGKSVPSFVEAPVKFITKANVDSYVPWDTGIAQIKSGKISLDVNLNAGK